MHTPSRRPTIEQILSSQWVNNQNITLESALCTTKASKKVHWFSRNRILQKNESSHDRSIDINLVQLHFNTKRANSVLDEYFLHPIPVPTNDDENALCEQEQQQQQQGATKTHRKSIFNGTLKKKVGPMEEKTKGNLFKRNSIDEKTSSNSCSEQCNDTRKQNNINLNEKSNANGSNVTSLVDEEEQSEFFMLPSCTNDHSKLHPLEAETRLILRKLGITGEMLCRASESGPRSDIIGAYRIVTHRLQRQQFLLKQQAECAAVAAANEQEQMTRPKTNRNCAIL